MNESYFFFSTKQHCQIKHFLVSATLNWKQHSAGLSSILKQECSLAKAWSKMQRLCCVRHTIDTWTAVCPGQELSGASWWLLLESCGCLPCSCLPRKKEVIKNKYSWNYTIQHANLAAGHTTHLECWMCSTWSPWKPWRAGAEVLHQPCAERLKMRVSPKPKEQSTRQLSCIGSSCWDVPVDSTTKGITGQQSNPGEGTWAL